MGPTFLFLFCWEALCLNYLYVGDLVRGDIEKESFSVPIRTGTLNADHIAFESGPGISSYSCVLMNSKESSGPLAKSLAIKQCSGHPTQSFPFLKYATALF